MTALTTGRPTACPRIPGAWLYRVAHNRLIGDLRRKAGRLRILERAAGDDCRDDGDDAGAAVFRRRGARRPAADALRLLRRGDPARVRLVLALKTLCGFSTARDRAAAVHQRGERAQAPGRARASGCAKRRPTIQTPPLETLRSRLPERARGALPALQRGVSLRARGAGDPPRAVRRGDPARRRCWRSTGGRGPRDLRAARAHAPARGAAWRAPRRDGRPAAPRGAGPVALGSRADALGAQWLAALGERRRVLALPRGGRHRRRALLRAVVRARRGGRRSPTSTRCWSGSPRRRCTR